MTSVFAPDRSKLFTAYAVEMTFRDKLLGGVPRDPKIIEGWLRTKTGVTDEEELRQMMLRTLIESGAEVTPDMSYEELERASEQVAAIKQTQGFKRDDAGLYVEARQINAMIKESVNILYAGDRWGATKKGPRSFTAERVFVEPDKLHLGRMEADGIEFQIQHIKDRLGARSSLSYSEFVEGASIGFRLLVTRDAIKHEHWPEIWLHAQENGFGASRSQGFGKFDVTAWEEVKQKAA